MERGCTQNLNKCFRCPKGHIDFNNYIMNDIQKKYCINNMESSNDNVRGNYKYLENKIIIIFNKYNSM
jgi:hypothetical protein